MKIWINNQFEGNYPVGTAAVVIAADADKAAMMLNDDLEARGLPRSAKTEDFRRVNPRKAAVCVLCDGDY